jgi:hypothetical protein
MEAEPPQPRWGAMLKHASPLHTSVPPESGQIRDLTSLNPLLRTYQPPIVHHAITNLGLLPDEPLRHIFDALSDPGPGWAGHNNRDAFALSCTCSRINNFYRNDYVAALDVNAGLPVEIVAEPGLNRSDMSPAQLARALSRLPRVTTLVIDHLPQLGPGLAVALASSSGRITSVTAEWVELDVAGMVDACPELETLSVCGGALGDAELGAAVDRLGETLRELRVPFTEITDAIGARLPAALPKLQTIDLSLCEGLTDSTFMLLGEYGPGLEELNLTDTSISDGVACLMLPRLTELRSLSLSMCTGITSSSVIRCLPQSLFYLDISFTSALADSGTGGDGDDDEASIFFGLSNLIQLSADNCGLADLSILEPIARKLEVLAIGSAYLSDECAAAALAQMPRMVDLAIMGSRVSDMSARVIGRMPRLRRLLLDDNLVTNSGVRFLGAGAARHTLEEVKLLNCDNTDNEDGAIDELRRSLTLASATVDYVALGAEDRNENFGGNFSVED